jgi:hypothetical protein
VLCLSPLTRLARVHVFRHVYILAHPERQASHQRPRLGPAKVSSGWPVVALAKHLRVQPAARWDAPPRSTEPWPHRYSRRHSSYKV